LKITNQSEIQTHKVTERSQKSQIGFNMVKRDFTQGTKSNLNNEISS
jgi:hypothetical protein